MRPFLTGKNLARSIEEIKDHLVLHSSHLDRLVGEVRGDLKKHYYAKIFILSCFVILQNFIIIWRECSPKRIYGVVISEFLRVGRNESIESGAAATMETIDNNRSMALLVMKTTETMTVWLRERGKGRVAGERKGSWEGGEEKLETQRNLDNHKPLSLSMVIQLGEWQDEEKWGRKELRIGIRQGGETVCSCSRWRC